MLVVLSAAAYGFVAAAQPPVAVNAEPVAVADASGPRPPAPRHDVSSEVQGANPAVRPAPRRLDVCVGGPFGAIPLRAVEVGPQGPIGEPAMFTNIDRFKSYMTAARTARSVQPHVRVDVWDHADARIVPKVFGACRDAGFRTVNVRGRVRTLAGEWREFDDVPVDLNELAPPAQAKSDATGGGGGKAGGCVFRPVPCRAPAYEP